MMQCENCCFYDDKENLCINENAMFNIDDECLSRIDNEDYKAIYNNALDDFLKKLKHEYSVLAKELPKEYKSVCENFEKIAEELRK